jgi:hypothetical protein
MRNGRSDSAKATLFLALALVLAALPANASAAGRRRGKEEAVSNSNRWW